jgi:hypothetical protein
VTFDLFIGIDYSGATTPNWRNKALQVYAARPNEPPQIVITPSCPPGEHWNWHRREIAEWLAGPARKGTRFIAGIDHGFSFPQSYFDRYKLTTWPEFLEDFRRHWPTDDDNTYVDFVREGNRRTGRASELRLCEKRTSSAKSVFHFDVQGSVAKSTHAGIPWLRFLRREVGERIHFWPFDGWAIPEGKSVIAEVYPSIFRNRYPRTENRIERSADQQDAYAVARWLEETTRRGFLSRYLDPPLTDEERRQAGREGWILGVA